jgi:hypothetical protein
MAHRWIPAAGVTLLILALTLGPVDTPSAPEVGLCIRCGDHWLADLLANIPFFTPLGAALGRAGLRLGPAVAAGLGLSTAIELAQLAIPGRFSSLADVAANTAGTALGVLLLRAVPRWLLLRGLSRRRAAASAVGVSALLLLAPALLQRPALPDSLYFPQWAPRLAHLEPWEGELHEVRVDDLPLPHAQTDATPRLRAKLLDGTLLVVTGSAAPPPVHLSAPFAVHDLEQREVLLLGQRGDELVWRLRRSASALALRQPSLRWPGALAGVEEGSPLHLEVRVLRGGRACLVVDGEERCGLEPSPGSGWAMLLPGDFLPAPWSRRLDMAWLAAVAFLPGLWVGPRPLLPAAIVLGAAALAPWVGPLAHLTAPAWAALVSGGGLGLLVGRAVRARHG